MDQENQLSEIEFDETEEEDVGVSIGPKERAIFTDKGDPEVTSLYDKYKRGRLVLQPDFQRKFVWDVGKSSRLIESALLDIPLPVIYLSEEKDGREYVIDGQQRLTAFFSFIDGIFPNGNDFNLTKLKVLKEIEKKPFRELSEAQQDKIKCCKIRTITFRKESSRDLKFEIFERLNTGAVPLNDQELRNCIYRGSYNDVLKILSEDGDFRYIVGIDKPEKRMQDVELVLRFSAFFHKTYLNYQPPIKNFLNMEMEDHRNVEPIVEQELRKAFKNSVQLIRSLLGENAFRRYYIGDGKNHNGRWEKKKFNHSLYDILMWSFAKLDKNKVMQNLDSIKEAFIYLMTTDEEFISSIEKSTSSIRAVRTRFDKWRLMLDDIVTIDQKEPRCFSRRLKEEMFNRNSTCAICGNAILDIDDSALDHIEQYWKGGKTIPENARLTHRYCNWARARSSTN